MKYDDYTRVGDLEVEGKLQLNELSAADCQCRRGDAVYTEDCSPSAEEYRSCVELVNELKERLNALIGALT